MENSNQSEAVHEGAEKTEHLKRFDNQNLPRTLDPVVTMAIVQRYIETERVRNRRALLWLSSTFILISVVILILFIVIGIFVLRNSNRASKLVDEVSAQTAVYASEVVDISGKIAFLQDNHSLIRSSIENRQARENEDKKRLKSDLERFGEWVLSLNSSEANALATLEDKLRKIERKVSEKDKELTEIREKYKALLNDSSLQARVKTDVDVVSEVSAGKFQMDNPDRDNVGNATDENIMTSSIASGALMPDISTNLVPQGIMHGEIKVVVLPNGDRYEGQFKEGFFNGWGVYYFSSGDRYEGEFRNDIKNGKGTFFYYNGDRYIGEFADDMKNGRGIMLFRNGDRYSGDFRSDMINGKGTILYQGGNKYAGDFKNGLRHGNGIIYFSNGDIYQGEFVDDIRTGKATYIFADGAKYIGEFKNGKREGNGRYIYASGEEYIGKFRDGKKEGEGYCVYPNGEKLKGLWRNDKLAKIFEQ